MARTQRGPDTGRILCKPLQSSVSIEFPSVFLQITIRDRLVMAKEEKTMSQSSADLLLEEAQCAPAKPSRSKLETHRAVIGELRRKRWTFAEIAGWLRERGVSATTSNVHRFFRQSKPMPPSIEPVRAQSAPPPAPVETEKPKRKIRYNIPI
jgi:transposase